MSVIVQLIICCCCRISAHTGSIFSELRTMVHLLQTTRDNFTHGYHQLGNTEYRLIIFFAAKNEETLHSQQQQQQQQQRLGADCSSDHELFIEKFRLN